MSARAIAAASLVPLLLVAACARPADEPPAQGSAPAGSVFSREAFSSREGDAAAGAGAPAVPTTADPAALDEILAAASSKPGAPDHDGAASQTPLRADQAGVLGTDTGVPADAGAERPAAGPGRGAKVSVGKVTQEPGMASPGIERAARAQLYWGLVQRCRDPDGAILPPEVVRVRYSLDRDGYVVPSSIHAAARDPRFAEAARCVERELGASTFRAPPAARGVPQWVDMDVPSVD